MALQILEEMERPERSFVKKGKGKARKVYISQQNLENHFSRTFCINAVFSDDFHINTYYAIKFQSVPT